MSNDADSGAPAGPDWLSWRSAVRAVLPWLLVGCAIRLLLLPTSLHPDLLSTYDRVRLLHAGRFELADYSFQALPILLHDLWARLLQVPLPDFSGVRWPQPTEGEIFEQSARLFAHPQALLWLALWKLPYLLTDLCVGIAVAWAVPRAQARFAGALWLLHPLAIYASSAFAKYEPFMLLPLVLGCGVLRRGFTTRALILIGIACAMRVYPLVLALPIAIAVGRTTRARIESLALIGLPLACVIGASASGHGLAWWLAAPLALAAWFGYRAIRATRWEWPAGLVIAVGAALFLPRLAERLYASEYTIENIFHHASFLADGGSASAAAGASALSPFLLGYGLLVLWIGYRTSSVADAERADFALEAALLSAGCLFGFAFFHPQYVALLAALACLSLHRAPGLAAAHGLQLVGALCALFAFAGGNTTVRLFLPLGPLDVASLPEPAEALPRALADLPWPVLGRTLLALGALWTAFELVRAHRASAASTGEPQRGLLWLGIAAWPASLALYAACCLRPEVVALRPTGDQLGANQVMGQGAIDFRVGDAAPDGLLVTTTQLAAAEPVRWRVQFFAEGPAPGQPALEAVFDHAELYPGASQGLSPGTLRIPLDRVQLVPGVRYRAVVLNEAAAPRAEQVVQALERVQAGDLLRGLPAQAWRRLQQARVAHFGVSVHAIETRYEPRSALQLGSLWLALLIVCALGAAFAFARERARRGSTMDAHD